MTRSFCWKSARISALAVALLVAGWAQPWRLLAQAPEPAKGVKFAQISPTDMKEWLTYLSSDELQGRQVFTEGYGNAAQYIADRLKEWGVKPIGEHGSYFQIVRLKSYRVARNSSVTVDVGGQSKTFKHGDHVTFAVNSGGKQTLTFNGAEFVGYGAVNAAASYDDFKGRDVKDKLVVTVAGTPAAVAQATAAAASAGAAGGGRGGGRGRAGGGGYAISALGAKAAIGFAATPAAPSATDQALAQAAAALTQAQDAVAAAQRSAAGGRGAGGFGAGGGAALAGRGNGRGGATVQADITNSFTKVDNVTPPNFTGDEVFYEFLFSGSPMKFAEIRAKAEKGEALPSFPIAAKITVNVDNTYEVVQEQLTKNVVGMVEGSDPKLKDTYVLFGAHLDHIGYSQTGGGNPPSPGGCRRRSPVALAALEKAGKQAQNNPTARGGGAGGGGGRGAAAQPNPTPFDERDFISNGADDDGSGSTAELAVAKAFATGPKPKRSIVFVWHSGEEAGLYGSRYNADFPIVPLEKVQAQLNMDMVGRDDCNNIEGDYTNSVFIVGDDRISTDLHNLILETNQTMTKPLELDYELNDPADPEGVYTRSDHYSYAAKGIPIAFFTTGLHPDYHRVTDTVEKITFPKMARIAQLVYQSGFAIANTDRTLERDNKGPRAGFGTKAEVIKK
jgi:Peptidase family M28